MNIYQDIITPVYYNKLSLTSTVGHQTSQNNLTDRSRATVCLMLFNAEESSSILREFSNNCCNTGTIHETVAYLLPLNSSVACL